MSDISGTEQFEPTKYPSINFVSDVARSPSTIDGVFIPEGDKDGSIDTVEADAAPVNPRTLPMPEGVVQVSIVRYEQMLENMGRSTSAW